MPHDQPVINLKGQDGHRFELIHVAAEVPQQTLLFLPGMGLSARLFIDFARTLADSGISVFIHEWRGNGSSSMRATRQCDWGYRELLNDVALARTVVAERTGGSYLLGGHSLGAQFTCMSAAANSQGCRGLIILAGGSPYWRSFPGWHQAMMATTMFAFPALGALFGYYPGKRVGFGGNEARGVMADWGRSARSGRYRPRGVEVDLEARFSELELPVLALRMADDWLAPEGSLDWLTGKLTGCETSKLVIEADMDAQKSAHYAWMERPDSTALAIEKWLTEAST